MSETPLWHTLDSKTVLEKLYSSQKGLSLAEATTRQTRDGFNELPKEQSLEWWTVFLRQLVSPFVYILVAASFVSMWLNEWVDAWVILAAVIVNTGIGFVQEFKANRALAPLHSLIQPKALVL